MAQYLVFGDLHGRILPAFRLAAAYAREHRVKIDAIVQVGDLGYFPDPTRLDAATMRHAADDPLELGAQLVDQPSPEADAVFALEHVPEALWFTAGNHEDFDALDVASRGMLATATDFPVDAYERVRAIRDGEVATLPGGLRVGAIWGIDDEAPGARRSAKGRVAIARRSVTRLSGHPFDVLLSHESPRDAILPGSGSEGLRSLLREARPAFSFFGHYSRRGGPVAGVGDTRVYHLGGLMMHPCAEPGTVGLLTWGRKQSHFAYLDPAWLRRFTRHNWETR